MKRLILIACVALPLAGCSTYQGGTPEQANVVNGAGEGSPAPANSPSFRPGLNREDPRSSQFINRPQPQGTFIP